MAQTLTDAEFGAIRVKRVHAAKHVRLKVTSEGVLVATLPNRAPLRLVKVLIEESREELRRIVFSARQSKTKSYSDNDRIGASHSLHFIRSVDDKSRTALRGQVVEVTIPQDADVTSPGVQELARKGVAKALKKEAAAYLPRRLSYIAEKYDFGYETIHYTNAKGRWGSCSSSGTISLNIALMTLPMEIIDYILIHELCHTKEMNHSPQFWLTVEAICPEYKDRRRALKDFTPYL